MDNEMEYIEMHVCIESYLIPDNDCCRTTIKMRFQKGIEPKEVCRVCRVKWGEISNDGED